LLYIYNSRLLDFSSRKAKKTRFLSKIIQVLPKTVGNRGFFGENQQLKNPVSLQKSSRFTQNYEKPGFFWGKPTAKKPGFSPKII